MLNYIWAGLIIAAFGFAIFGDLSAVVNDRYRNGTPLPLNLVLPESVDLDGEGLSVRVEIDEATYRDHFRIGDDEFARIVEKMSIEGNAFPPPAAAATLRPLDGVDVYELTVTDLSKMPPRLVEAGKLTAWKKPLLNGKVSLNELPAGETVSIQLDDLPQFQMYWMRSMTLGAFNAGESAVTLALGLIGGLALWLGVVKIAEHGGLVNIFVAMIRPVLGKLFPEIPKDHPALGMIALNLGANVLGLGNAATPMGIKAMHEMQKLNNRPDTATNSMCMFLSMNTASVMLVPPATLVGIMGVATGQLWVPIVIVTGLSLMIAIIACRSLQALPVFKASDPALAVGPPPDAVGESEVVQADDAKGGA